MKKHSWYIIILISMIMFVIAMGGLELYLLTDHTEPAYHSRDWDGDDSYVLAQLAMSECQWMDIEDKIMIINIAVNRVWDEDYPGTIEEVVSEMTHGDYLQKEPDAECLDAEHHVQIDGWDNSGGLTEYKIEDHHVVPL